MRMVGTLLQEQDDEWQVAERRYFSAEWMRKIDVELREVRSARSCCGNRLTVRMAMRKVPPLDGTRPSPICGFWGRRDS